MEFEIQKKLKNSMGRAGKIQTPHGVIETPAFVAVATKGTLKAITPEQIEETGVQVVLSNTYHLYLQPGDEIVRDAGGLNKFMNYSGPTMTDSGGFQVFSLGAGFDKSVSKFTSKSEEESIAVYDEGIRSQHGQLAIVDEEGVSFTSHIDGALHRFTPERSIEIQHNIGADMIFAFDECTSADAPHEYQKEAMDRTHRWADRSLKAHRQGLSKQAIFGIVQGGRYEDLRKESAEIIGEMNFDGYGIGGSFSKEDMGTAVKWVNEILPPEKPKHLLGIGEPLDLFLGIENGADLFDCVAPTRLGRNGTIYTPHGKVNLLNQKYIRDFTPFGEYTYAYMSHLFRAKEMLGSTLASIHNVKFISNLVKDIRQSILDDNFYEFKEEFLKKYYV